MNVQYFRNLKKNCKEDRTKWRTCPVGGLRPGLPYTISNVESQVFYYCCVYGINNLPVLTVCMLVKNIIYNYLIRTGYTF